MPPRLVLFLALATGCTGDITGDSAVSITLHTDATGVGLAGAEVSFQRPDETIATLLVTDARGEASALLPDGGMVSVTWHDDGDTVFAFITVGPGEHVDLAVTPGLRGVGSRPRVRMIR